MKKSLLILCLGLLCVTAQAIPADPAPVQVTQPDGSTLTVQLHGDEFFHFTTTADGYTVVKNAAGYYTYARLDGGNLVAGDRIARDAANRSADDRAALALLPKGLTSNIMAQTGQQRLSGRNQVIRRVGADGHMDYERFRGLIILINFTDQKFAMDDANDFYNKMVNEHDFTGYYQNGRRVSMTGSVRDYFYDNSNHIFDPTFDIVGPVEVDYSCTDPQSSNNAGPIFRQALQRANSLVDYSDYDADNDGTVDMVFFLVAGFSANYSGNNEDYLWPHMYYLWNVPRMDGMAFSLYACSTEIAGWEGYYSDTNGIGTFCHEFGHVLGLPDLYDTDYNGSGGSSLNPGSWSIMAGGSGSNYGRNPVGYSLYERYALGFTQPQLIEEAGDYTLQPLANSNLGYRLNTPIQDEFFLIENRQATKWDRYLPGHGMMIARVDSTNAQVWWNNQVNVDPNRMYFELLRANYTGEDSNNDPFPGASHVTSIDNFSEPSLLTWGGFRNDFMIRDIAETGDVITFTVQADSTIKTAVEDFEEMAVGATRNESNVKGVFAHWNFVKCAVAEVEEGVASGSHAVSTLKPCQFTTTGPINIKPVQVQYSVYNPTGTSANFRFYYSVDSGQTWVSPNEGYLTVESKSSSSAIISMPTDAPVMLRFAQVSGSSKAYCYIDDITLLYQDTWGIEDEDDELYGDVNGDGEITISDANEVINIILGGSGNKSVLDRADLNRDGEYTIADVNVVIDLILGAQ